MNELKGSRQRCRPVVVIVGLMLASVPAGAQLTRMPPPAESGYWWTLTDEVSPSELRRQLQDRDLIRARFRAASEQGQLHEAVTEQQIQEVSSFIDGALHPELVPMHLAFGAFSGRFEYRPDWSEQGPALLSQYGITPDAVQQLVNAASEYEAASDDIAAEITPSVMELMALLRPWVDEIGNETLVTMLVEEDFSGLARLTGRDVASIARLKRAWERDPSVEAALPILAELRKELSTDDWNAFRHFLLVEVAPLISGVDYRGDR